MTLETKSIAPWRSCGIMAKAAQKLSPRGVRWSEIGSTGTERFPSTVSLRDEGHHDATQEPGLVFARQRPRSEIYL